MREAETRLLHDPFQVLGPRVRVNRIQVSRALRRLALRVRGRRAPQDHRHAAAGALRDLPTAVADHLRLSQIMVRRECLLTARVFVGPSMSAIAPNIVPPELLPRAIAMSAIAFYGASITGPAMGGFLYAVDPALTYWTGAVCLGVAIVAVSFVRPVRPPPIAGRAHPFQQMVDGLTYVRNHRFLLGAITLDLFAVLLGGATALLPVFARDILMVGPEGLGWLRAAPAAGGAVVALWLAWRPIHRNVGVKMLLGVAIFGVATVVFGLSRSLPLSLAALAILGAADMLSVYVRSSLVQLHTPDTMRGRVSAVSGLAISASNELGELESGLLAALLGPVGAVVAGGAGALAVTGLYAYYFPELRRARTFDPPDTALPEAIVQERPT